MKLNIEKCIALSINLQSNLITTQYAFSVWYPHTGYAIKRLENIQIGVA